MRNLSFLVLALATGCATTPRPPPDASPAAAGPVKAPEAGKPAPPVAAAPSPSTHSPASPAPVAGPPAAPASAHAPATPAKAAGTPPAPTTPAKAPATSAVAAKAPTAPAPAAPVAAPLDLKKLEERLKDTKAIGLFTKLSLKNQVDDLLGKFRTYHGGQQPPTLTELRPNYELLIMKVQSLIQADDPALANDVASSREAIWGVLADKNKFISI